MAAKAVSYDLLLLLLYAPGPAAAGTSSASPKHVR